MSRFHALGHLCACVLWFISFRRTALGHISKHGSLRVSSNSCWGGRIPNLNCQLDWDGVMHVSMMLLVGTKLNHKNPMHVLQKCQRSWLCQLEVDYIGMSYSLFNLVSLLAGDFQRTLLSILASILSSIKPPHGEVVLPIICLGCMKECTFATATSLGQWKQLPDSYNRWSLAPSAMELPCDPWRKSKREAEMWWFTFVMFKKLMSLIEIS